MPFSFQCLSAPCIDLVPVFTCFPGCLSERFLHACLLLLQIAGTTDEGEVKPKLCPALEARFMGTYNITFQAQYFASKSSQQRRRLLGTNGAYTVIDYNGYQITRPDFSTLQYANLDGAPELRRWIGGSKGGNRVLGGLVLHTTRRGLDMSSSLCNQAYSHLSTKCAQKQLFDR